MLANAQAYGTPGGLSPNLSRPRTSSWVPGAATKTPRFQMLARASQRENTKFRDIARRIVDNTVNRGLRETTEGSGAE